jgi:hypothetical protein
MKITTSALTLLLVLIGSALSLVAQEIPDNIGPETIKLKISGNALDFQHRKHQETTNKECFHCHKVQEWKIKKWNKDVAHEVCIACHDLNDKGPVECQGCHKY